MGSDGSHFNVSFIVEGKVTRQTSPSQRLKEAGPQFLVSSAKRLWESAQILTLGYRSEGTRRSPIRARHSATSTIDYMYCSMYALVQPTTAPDGLGNNWLCRGRDGVTGYGYFLQNYVPCQNDFRFTQSPRKLAELDYFERQKLDSYFDCSVFMFHFFETALYVASCKQTVSLATLSVCRQCLTDLFSSPKFLQNPLSAK